MYGCFAYYSVCYVALRWRCVSCAEKRSFKGGVCAVLERSFAQSVHEHNHLLGTLAQNGGKFSFYCFGGEIRRGNEKRRIRAKERKYQCGLF